MDNNYDPEERFDKRAADYDKDIPAIIPGYDSLHETTLFILKNAVGAEAKILVAGAGTGNESILFATYFPGWTFYGFDISSEMISRAEKKIREYDLGARISIIRGSVDYIIESGFDAALSLLVMHFVKDKAGFVKSIYKKLKPGGVFLTADIAGKPGSGEFSTMMNALKDYQLEKRKDPEKVEETLRHISNDLHIISETETAVLLSEAGFINVFCYYRNLIVNSWYAEKPL